MTVNEITHWTSKELYEKVELDQIDLDTEYQRELIWNNKQERLLIDSILWGMDIPKLYFARFTDENRYQCIDGKQRINSVVKFYKGEIEYPKGKKYGDLKRSEKKKFDNYEFTVSIITDPTQEYINELFKRLNLGTPLNGAERLHATTGDMRDFVFRKIGKEGPFISNVNLSQRRFSRELTIAQIAINSKFFRGEEGFNRARWEDLDDFFRKHEKFSAEEKTKTKKIKDTLEKMDAAFGDNAQKLRSRASIVSAYLFVEKLVFEGNVKDLGTFVEFYLKLFDRISDETKLIKDFKPPKNRIILEEFHKNLQQASVEPYSIRRRHDFLSKAFDHYKKTGKIIGD